MIWILDQQKGRKLSDSDTESKNETLGTRNSTGISGVIIEPTKC